MFALVCIWPPIPDTKSPKILQTDDSFVPSLSIPLLAIRKHKKGLEEDVTKKRTRRAQKFQRAVVGATLQV